jgi:Ran GTPase-activating protein (RanGAP) involved in mRNA processing and transport
MNYLGVGVDQMFDKSEKETNFLDTLITYPQVQVFKITNLSLTQEAAIEVNNLLKNNSQITELTIHTNKEAISYLKELFPSLIQLTSINLSRNGLTGDKIVFLNKGLSSCSSLTNLNLNSNKITDLDIEHLTDTLTQCTRLTRLHLIKNQIRYKGIDTLCRLFKSNSSIQLEIADNPIGFEGVRILSLCLPQKRINSLSLINNSITDRGILTLSTALKQHFNLTKLDLSQNQIGQEGLKKISSILKKNKILYTLNLKNINLNTEGSNVLAKGLTKNNSLRILDLSANSKMGLVGIQHIVTALKNQPALELFIFNNNCLGDEGAELFASFIAERNAKNQLFLQLRSNKIGSTGVSLIASVSKNSNLKGLDLSCNPLTDASFHALLRILQTNSNLQNLILQETEIGATVALSLGMAISSHPSLISFSLDIVPKDNETCFSYEQFYSIVNTNKRLVEFNIRSKRDMPKSFNEIILSTLHKNQRQWFTEVIIMLAYHGKHASKPNSYWALLPKDIQGRIIAFLCLQLDRKFGKTTYQLLLYTQFILQEIENRVNAKLPITVKEKINSSEHSFSFFNPKEKPTTSIADEAIKPLYHLNM